MIVFSSNRGREQIQLLPNIHRSSELSELRFIQDAADYDQQAVRLHVSGLEDFAEFLPGIVHAFETWAGSGGYSELEWQWQGRSLSFCLKPTDEIVATVGKTVLTVSFKSLLLSVEFRMVVDGTALARTPDSPPQAPRG
jgi:hypothetical protein